MTRITPTRPLDIQSPPEREIMQIGGLIFKGGGLYSGEIIFGGLRYTFFIRYGYNIGWMK